MRSDARRPTLAAFAVGALLGCNSAPQDAAPETLGPDAVSPDPRDARPALPNGFALAVDEYVEQWGRHWPSFRYQGVTMVADDGTPVFVRPYGYRDLASELPHDVDSRFAIGTLSAHLTAATVARMVEAGTLDLAVPVHRYLSDFPDGDVITVEHLLTHTAGLPSFTDEEPFRPRRWDRLPGKDHVELLGLFAGKELQFEPGTDFAPSNSNYAVLGRIIEVTGDGSYEEVVRREVLAPLGMHDTTFGEADAMLAIGLRFTEVAGNEEHLEPITGVRPRGAGAAAGWISTAADLARFYEGLTDRAFLSRRTFERMLGENPTGTPYAWVSLPIAHRTAYAWKGLFDGHNSAVLWIPSEHRVVIALSNSEVVPGDAITTNVAHLAYGVEPEEREEARPVPLPARRWSQLAGQWMLTDETKRALVRGAGEEAMMRVLRAHIDARDDAAVLRLDGEAKRVYALGEGRFFFKDLPQSTARLVRGSAPAADHLVLARDDLALRYRREHGSR